MQISFIPLNASLLKETARLHVQHMPADLATRLGMPVVHDIFHDGTLNYEGGIAIVAQCNGTVAGFCFAHVDFRAFSIHQRARRFRFYGRVLLGLLHRPQLLPQLFASRRYLAIYSAFVNLGPLLVAPEFRYAKPDGVERFSLAGELARRAFTEIAAKAPNLPVLTMIRPDNLPSITAVAQGARQAGFKLRRKLPIDFGRDRRLVFEYGLC